MPLFLKSCLRLSKVSKSWKETVVLETVKIIHFGEGSQYKSAKHRVDALDTENLTHSYTIVEGDALAGVLESITYHVKIVPTEDGGCICKNRSIYHTKGDVEINEEKIKEGKEKAMQMFKAIEAYLQANA
ncbi:Major allergen Pru ar 1 [Sesamum angolense]|uniref:Major allergen Pru ar 1 n=1 Tax=Sesamum angolense TaxID=2727404 RepID=A0AAE1XH42_9LAMI|nr:Major allergen Pru ar 1 [Sesamum angolense]